MTSIHLFFYLIGVWNPTLLFSLSVNQSKGRLNWLPMLSIKIVWNSESGNHFILAESENAKLQYLFD